MNIKSSHKPTSPSALLTVKDPDHDFVINGLKECLETATTPSHDGTVALSQQPTSPSALSSLSLNDLIRLWHISSISSNHNSTFPRKKILTPPPFQRVNPPRISKRRISLYTPSPTLPSAPKIPPQITSCIEKIKLNQLPAVIDILTESSFDFSQPNS